MLDKRKKKIVTFDFDGVISTYEGWRGFDVLGEPVPEAIEAIRQLKKEGYVVIIFTTRLDTPILRKWLKDNNVPFDGINKYKDNPPHTSNKPAWHCYVDDRAVNFSEKHNKLSTQELIRQIKNRIEEAKHEKKKT